MAATYNLRAESLARALGGRPSGAGYVAPCPAHEDRSPSLSISAGDDGRLLVHCFAGCSQDEVIAALREKGLWPIAGSSREGLGRGPAPSILQPAQDVQRRTEMALHIWRSCRPAHGTLAERYCRNRGINLELPDSLRFSPSLRHYPSGGILPAMVAAVRRGSDGQFLGIHRTYLAADGSSKAAVVPNKMMLGPCLGGAVRLAPLAEHLMVGEGIETCLAAMQASGLPAWAALSTSGMKALCLPEEVRRVTILADGDEPGERAAVAAGRRWSRQGRLVKIARPPRGLDFNDMLLGTADEVMAVARVL